MTYIQSKDALRAALTPDTILVSVMHVNNEAGSIMPLAQIRSEIDRVNQKAAKKEKKNAKKAAKSAPVEEKPVAPESKILFL